MAARRHVMDMYRLDGRVALVTGGARKLGFDMAEALGEAGASLAITSRELDKAQIAAKRLCKATGLTAKAYALDVTDEQSIDNGCVSGVTTYKTTTNKLLKISYPKSSC